MKSRHGSREAKEEMARSPLAQRIRATANHDKPLWAEEARANFLARCATAYDAGLFAPDRLKILQRWVEIVMRLEGGQLGCAVEMLQEESERTNGFRSGKVLANDSEGYGAVQLLALLTHSCQQCATNPEAWWTRPGFCQHRS